MYVTPNAILEMMDNSWYASPCNADETDAVRDWLIVTQAEGDAGSQELDDWQRTVNNWSVPCLIVCIVGLVEIVIWYTVCRHAQEKHLFSFIAVLVVFAIVQTKFNALRVRLNTAYIDLYNTDVADEGLPSGFEW